MGCSAAVTHVLTHIIIIYLGPIIWSINENQLSPFKNIGEGSVSCKTSFTPYTCTGFGIRYETLSPYYLSSVINIDNKGIVTLSAPFDLFKSSNSSFHFKKNETC